MEEKEVQKVGRAGVKFTPLNLLVAVSLVAAVYFLRMSTGDAIERGVNGLFTGLSLVAAVVFFISDLIFRKIFPSIKKLWIVELSFIAFAAIMTLIIKIVLFN